MKYKFLFFFGLALFAFRINAQTSFTDPRDGNVYDTITIGTQVWMKENLRYLPSVVGPATASETTLYYYVYDYNGTSVTDAKATYNYTTYGVLYNWPAASISCPCGWHLPSLAEWTQLSNYLGGESIAGGKLKETGTTHWVSPNIGATNESGFTALPSGIRSNLGTFWDLGYASILWTSSEKISEYPEVFVWYRYIHGNGIWTGSQWDSMDKGFAVRCVKDSAASFIKDNSIDKQIQIYPNPATDKLTINYTKKEKAKMQVYNMLGKCVFTIYLQNGINDIDISILTKGVYVILIMSDIWTCQYKLTKE